MSTLIWILLSTLIISLISLIGIISISLKEKLLKKILVILVSFSAGALMASAFLDLIPEALQQQVIQPLTFIYILVGFTFFFFVEKVLHWRHCHKEDNEIHTYAHMSLIGDSIHNFIDGLIIAASFIVSIPLGVTTSIAITLHEIPQELGNFGILIHGGYKKYKALILNFVTALTAILGGLIGYFLSSQIEGLMVFLLSIAAGGFIYISASDLIPEIRKETSLRKSLLNIFIFITGILLIYILTAYIGG